MCNFLVYFPAYSLFICNLILPFYLTYISLWISGVHFSYRLVILIPILFLLPVWEKSSICVLLVNSLIITVLIGVGFLIRFVDESFGKPGTIIALIILWFVIRSIDPYEHLPHQLLTDTFINIYEFFQ